MVFEVEHPAGTSDADIKIREMEAKKDNLAAAFGVSREKLDDWVNEIKGFFAVNRTNRKMFKEKV